MAVAATPLRFRAVGDGGRTERAAIRVQRLLPSGDEAGTAPEDRSFRPDIEGLRAVAVVFVLLRHSVVSEFPGGFVGVDVFFVISGFVITGLLLRERTATGRTKVLGFYARRARRILPMALFVIVATLIAERVLFGASVVAPIAQDARWATLFLANYPRHVNIFAVGPLPLGVYWSLAVEEQFYVVYPALFIAVCALGHRWPLRVRLGVFLGVVIAGSFAWSVYSSPSSLFAYQSPFTRAWELAAGCLLAVCTRQLVKIPSAVAAAVTWAGLLALVVIGLVLTFPALGYPGWIASLPVTAAALIIAGGTAAPRYGAEILLRTAPFKWVGRWSYSIYLWHFPILILATQHWGPLSGVENMLLCAGAVALSAATYYYIENPIRHSKVLVNSPAASVAMGLLLVAVCLAVTFVI